MLFKPEEPLRPAWLRIGALAVLAVTLSALAWYPAIHAYPATGSGDGQFFLRMIDSGKVSVSRYHELPLWNAYECGGVPLWDNPQAIDGSPLMLLLTPLSATASALVWFVLHSALGFVGMWLFARRELGLTRAAAFASSALFAFAVAHMMQYSGGHLALVTFLNLPLALHFWRRAEQDLGYAVGLGLLLALMFYEGAVYPLPHVCLVLAAETLTRLWPGRRIRRILAAAAVMLVVFVTVASARLFPVVDQLVHHKRALGDETDAILWQTLKDMVLDRTHSWGVAGQQYVWPEFAAYCGPIVLAIGAIGIAASLVEATWFTVLGFLVFALMMGHFAHWAPWSILKHHVFPFSSMRVPSRFRLLEMMFVAGWLGIAMDRVPHWVRRVTRNAPLAAAVRTVMLGVAFLGVGDVISVAGDVVASKFVSAPEATVAASEHLYYGGALAAYLDQPRQNRGRLDCWEEWNFTAGAPLWTGDVPQARPAGEGVVVGHVDRTPSSFTLDVDVTVDGARVLVNGAWDRGWRSNVGRVVEVDKQLAVDLPVGHQRVRLWYWPVGFTAGLALTGAGLLGACAFFYLRRRRRRVSASG